MFGGYCKASNTTLNDIHYLDTSMKEKKINKQRLIKYLGKARLEWKKVTWVGEGPIERYEHSATVIGDNIYIFGGGNTRGWLNDVQEFNTGKN